MPTTPSPYNYNNYRYGKVPKRVKSGGSCPAVAFVLLAVPTTVLTAIGGLIAQNV